MFDKNIMNSALQKQSKNEANGEKIHLIFALGDFRNILRDQPKLEPLIIEGMMKFQVKSVMVTFSSLIRNQLITQSAVEDYCKGVYESINDDIQSVFDDIRLGLEPYELIRTYFLPKLTEEELALVELNDSIYLQSFWSPFPNPRIAGMKNEFVLGECERRTLTINNLKRQRPLD